jgi:hypothetical protein
MKPTIEDINTIITQALATGFETMHADGFVPPFAFSVISADGQIYAGHYVGEWENLEVEWINAPTEGDIDLQMPLYMTLVDTRGEGAGMLIAAQNIQFLRWPSPARSDTGH